MDKRDTADRRPTPDLSSLPSVDAVLKSEQGQAWLRSYPHSVVVKMVRETLDELRSLLLSKRVQSADQDCIYKDVDRRIKAFMTFSLKPVINATGIVIHTNLGRSVLSEDLLDHVKKVSGSYSTLEYDLHKGQRGKRYSHVQRLLKEITGAEDALIVNNNAAAVFVSLRELAKGKEVIVSRGELVEIGGSFRVPDVMAESGAILREVGTTNKTHLHDYERAINENTALLLKVHQSNFRTVGFVKSVEIGDLVKLGKSRGLPVMFDLGSGCLVDLKPYGIHIEPTVQEIVSAGCDIVTFSGDKLLGGPQGGVIVGKSQYLQRIAKNPLMRAVRVDKMTLSAFEAILLKYLDPDKTITEIPTLSMILQDIETIRKRAVTITEQIRRHVEGSKVDVTLVADESEAGGGSLPEVKFKTFVTALKPKAMSVNALERRLRHCDPPVIARIKDEALIVDARTIKDNEIDLLVAQIKKALSDENLMIQPLVECFKS